MKLTPPPKAHHNHRAGPPYNPRGGGYHFSNGEPARAPSVEILIKKGMLVAGQDGLLEGFTQTYHAVQP